MNRDFNIENLDVSVTIIREELNQFSHAFNNYQVMMKQIQSLITEIAQLRLLSIIPISTSESRTQFSSQVFKILHPDSFTDDRLELDAYLIHYQYVFLTQSSLFLMEQYKILYIIFYLKGNVYS